MIYREKKINYLICFFKGYVGLQIFDSSIKEPLSGQKLKNDIRHALIFLCFGLGLSPVLYKLTDTISTDTIYTTSGLMLFIHLVFHNYGLEKSAVVSKALSLNAGNKSSKAQSSFTSLMADLREAINRVFSFSRCLNVTFP